MTEIPSPAQPEDRPISLAAFLEGTPPGSTASVEQVRVYYQGLGGYAAFAPNIQLHCDSEHCGGQRFFSCRTSAVRFPNDTLRLFLTYACRNCNSTTKTFALLLVQNDNSETAGTAFKYGEEPGFGPPTPSRLVSLIGPDRNAFLKGRRSENQGLGVGAFAYYRRVVENQKNRLIDEIMRVAEKTRATPEALAALSAAKVETQFTRAVDLIKDSIPQSLLIDGHNPMTLLHDALSNGLHAQTDEECLAIATSIRVILEELTEKTSAALRDHAELRSALSKLLNRSARAAE